MILDLSRFLIAEELKNNSCFLLDNGREALVLAFEDFLMLEVVGTFIVGLGNSIGICL